MIKIIKLYLKNSDNSYNKIELLADRSFALVKMFLYLPLDNIYFL